jgi:hypothetical protein
VALMCGVEALDRRSHEQGLGLRPGFCQPEVDDVALPANREVMPGVMVLVAAANSMVHCRERGSSACGPAPMRLYE